MVNPRAASCVRSDRRHTFYWMNTWAVWVQVSKMKVGYGIERSCTTRRRKRGLRVGKRRSRGGKPRRSVATRPPPSNECGERPIKRACREFDFWESKLTDVVRICKERALPGDWFNTRGEPTPFALFVQRRLTAVNRGIKRSSKAAHPLMVPSLSFLVEKHLRLTWPGTESAFSVLSQLRPSERLAMARTYAELDLRSQGVWVRRPGSVCRHCGGVQHWIWEVCPRLANLGDRASLPDGRNKKKGQSKRKRNR